MFSRTPYLLKLSHANKPASAIAFGPSMKRQCKLWFHVYTQLPLLPKEELPVAAEYTRPVRAHSKYERRAAGEKCLAPAVNRTQIPQLSSPILLTLPTSYPRSASAAVARTTTTKICNLFPTANNNGKCGLRKIRSFSHLRKNIAS